jgi:hypothetical protein
MSDDTPFDGMSSLIRLIGFNVPARAQFVAEAMVSSTMTSITMGVLGGMIGSTCLPIGPLIPFFIGSWTGYTVGLLQHWRQAQHETFQMAHYYPTILGHGLYTEFGIVVPPNVIHVVAPAVASSSSSRRRSGTSSSHPRSNVVPPQSAANETTTLSTATTTTLSTLSTTTTSPMEDWIRQGGIGRLTWSILAAQSCRNDIKDLQRQERQKLMDAHQQQQDNDSVDNDEEV